MDGEGVENEALGSLEGLNNLCEDDSLTGG